MKRLLTKRQTVAILAITISTVLFASSAKAELPDWPGIFDPNLLPTLNIQMDPCDWDTILNNIPDANGCIETEIELPALFWADGEEASQILVAVRRKKSFAFPDEINPEKVALKIDINQYVTGQEWHGLNKLSLEANLDSVDLITEGLSVNLVRMGSMTEGFDYPTWYGNWVKVYVNGAYKGVYFNNEQRDKQYMQNHNFYSYHTSWLYKYADCEPGFVRKVGDDANPASPAVKALCYQPFVHPGGGDPNLQPPGGECSVPDDNTIIADMNQWVNVRRMLNNAAINSFMANSDDLFNHNNNTYFMDFNDANGTKRVYLAWDTDATFKDTEWDMYYTSTAQTYNSVILDIPVFRSQYNQIIRELLDGPFTEANIHAFLDNINTPELQAAIAADPYNQVGGNVPAKVAELKTWISDRIKNVRNQVDWDEPILPPGIVLLNDAFDGTVWDANWEGGHSWVEDNSVYAHAAPSAKAPAQSGGDFTCNPVDTNDATAIHIDFWFQKDDTEDTDDFLLYYYDGTSYNQIADLDTLGADDEWLHYTDTITNSNYFIPDFRIRFSGTPDRNEEVWVDEVVITKEIQQYTITATADANGTVDPNGAIIKNAGEDQLFTTTPNGSYTVDTWYVDGNNVQVGGTTYTLTNIQANHTVYVTFEQLQYTLTVNTVGSGSVTKSPDQATYTYGSIVDVNAIADAGWTFSAWSGDLGGSTNPETITMDGNKTVTATFTQDQYTLTINTVGSGSVTKSPDQATYTYGSIVDVNAIADAGWTFSAWSGDLGGSTNPETITMDGNKTVTATFTQDQYTLTINTVGSGSVAKVPDQATYTYGAVVTLTANPNVGWSFANWSGDMAGSTNPDTITMDGNRTITATFTEDQYTLTINTVGSGSVTRSPDQATYTYGSIVDVNAIADAGWTFSEWSGDLTGSTNPDSITMDGNKTVTATFTEDQYTLTINTVGSGSVTRSPDQATYTYGSIVDVNAIADAGWTFSEWSGDLTGSTNPDSITMDGNKTVTATFTEDQYTLTINTVGSGSVTRSPDQATYTYGSIVDVNAIADAGWTFSEWSGDLGGSTNPETITMDGNKTVTATFTEDQYTLTINTVGSGSVTKSPDQATYTYGSIVDVNAIADAGWTFSAWSGDLGGSTNPETITMDGNKTVTATFTEDQYTLTINTVGSGSVTKSPDQATYTYGTIVDVNAIADAGWTFLAWSGDLGGSTNPETITMDGNKTVTATFTEDQYTLTINTVGSGSVTKSPDQATYTYGTIVDVNAIADAGWTFSEWSGDLTGSTNPDSITMDGNKTVTATFTEDQYTLTINTVGSGSVTKSPDQATYTYGTIVDVNAIADAGWTFLAWSGDLGGSTNPETITMDGNKTVTATFTEDQYTLTINTVGSGSVTKSPDQATYTYGSIVDVNAIADAGWTFSEWSGDLGGSTNPETITMDGNKTVTATFTEDQYTLTINTVGSGSVTKSPDQATYTYGTIVDVNAIADAGWTFSAWSGDLGGSTNPETITMDGNKTITATFTQDQYTLTINTVGNGSVTKSPDQATYTYGTIVDVNAIADAGWTFSAWSGDLGGSTNPETITMDGNKTVTATFTEDQYTLTINTVGSGSVTKSPDQATYTYGTIVDVNAIADAGWTFSAWSGDLGGSTNPETITMDGNKTITATFTQDQYTLTINTVGNGSVTKSPDQATYTYGSIVDVNAIADAGWTFSVWSGDLGGSTNPETITMDGNKTVTATFTEDQYTLTINTVGSGSVTKSPDQATYTYGSIVDVNAIADAGWTFSEWSGDLGGSTNPETITMDGNKTVTATFTEDQYTLTINTVGSGSVTKSPDQATYTYGTIVDVNAIADAGWTFSAWSGDLGGSTNPETITMDGNRTITATFTEDQYTLTINTVGNGSVTRSPDQATYTYGSIVDVNAIADAGWTFANWSGDLGGSTNPETITMDGNKTITATFTEDQYTLTINTVGNGSVTKSPDQATYTYGSIVDVNAIADAGWTFSVWSGDLGGSTNPETITMNGNRTITATFTEDQYTLTINTVGNGSVTRSPDQATYTYGSIVDVNAIADAGWTFANWSGDLGGSTNPETITMNGNRTITATFTEDQYTLTINTVGNGSVTKSPDQATYTYGSIVDVNAIADAGWTFANWSGDLGGSTNPETITMDGNKTVTATFTEDQYTLTINTVGSGSVTKSPDQATYTYGSIVDVNAIADAGWTFSAWSGDLGGSTNPETITMDGNRTITATFTEDQYTLTINTVGNGSVTKSPDQATYTYGSIVDVNAIADAGWTFSAWSGDLGGSTNPETITMDGNKTVTATFTEALLSDNFDDNRRSAMWRSFANNYDNAWVVENTNRLNVRATGNVNNLIAFYVANGWSFDVNESFAIEVDFHYSGISDQNGWAGITVENNDGYVSISAGSDGYESYFYYEGIVDGNMVSEQELRGSNDGTLYISYDADSNNLYLSHVGYGSGNAYIWQTISNPLQVQWTSPVDVAVGGGSDEVVLGLGEAYLDNFEIATATLLGWPPATDLDSDGFIGWGDVAIMRGHWLDTIVHPDLVGHWKMNDNATNTTVVDSSGNGNDGTAQQNTSVLHTNGKINGALTFDGTTDYVDCGDIDIGTGPRTFAAWVRADSTSGVTTIIGKDTGGATTEAGWLYQSSSNILWKLRNPAGSGIRMFSTTLTTGGWHFLVATYDTTDMHVYFDGVLDDGLLLGAVPDSVPDNSIPLQIGARGNGAFKFNGTIDNVMIFNKALSPEEIAALYNAGNGTETGPGDINNDGIVNFLDFAELGLAW